MNKTKNKRGRGSIHQRKDDRRWVAVLPLGVVNGRRRRIYAYAETESLAYEALDIMRAEHKDGEVKPARADRQKLETFLTQRWLPHFQSQDRSPATVRIAQQNIRVHLAPALGDIDVTKLTTEKVDTMLAAMNKNGKSARLRQLVLQTLSSAMEQARKWKLVKANPCDDAERPRAPKPKVMRWSVEQAATFLQTAQSDRLYALYVLALTTGARQGELLGLLKSDFDAKVGRLSFTATLKRDEEGKLVRGVTKTGATGSSRCPRTCSTCCATTSAACSPKGCAHRRGCSRTRMAARLARTTRCTAASCRLSRGLACRE